MILQLAVDPAGNGVGGSIGFLMFLLALFFILGSGRK